MTTLTNTALINHNMTKQTIWGNASETRPMAVPARMVSAMRHLAQKWDLFAVVMLMASSAAYGLFALAHVA